VLHDFRFSRWLAGPAHVRHPVGACVTLSRWTEAPMSFGSVYGDQLVGAVQTGYEREKASRDRCDPSDQGPDPSMCRPMARLHEARWTGRRTADHVAPWSVARIAASLGSALSRNASTCSAS
jgi:hypothetical protein